MKHLIDWWRANSWDIFALIGIFFSVRTVVVAIARWMLRRRSDEYYTRRNRLPPDHNGNHPSGKGY